MISARLQGGENDRPVILLGIDERNVEGLKKGLPIKLDGKLLELDVDIIISYGARLQDIVDELAHAGVDVPVQAHEAAKFADTLRGGGE